MQRSLPLVLSAVPAFAQVVDEQRIDPPDFFNLHEQAQLGYAMALAGEEYLVTVPGRKGGEGSVLRYERDAASGTWVLRQEFQVNQPQAQTYLGISIGFDGERVVAGSPYRSVGGDHFSGKAYVFARDPVTGDFDQAQGILPSNGGKDHYFGYASDIEGKTLVVAAPLAGPAQEGIVYVFERGPGGKYKESQQLTANLPGPWPLLGETLDLDGDVLVAGSGTFNGTAATPAVVWRRPGPGSPFVFEQFLSAGPQAFLLPIDVSVDGDRILVGSREQVIGGKEGRAYLYEYDALAGQWNLAHELEPLDTVTEHFAFTVDLLGDRAMIGNYYHGAPTAQEGPLVQVAFEDPLTGAWTLEAVGDPAAVGTEWLASVVLTTPFAGFAHRGFHSLPEPAYVYVFGFADAPLGADGCAPPNPNSTGLTGRLLGRGSADVLANALEMEAWDLPPNELGYLLVADGRGGAVVPPGSQGLLCLDGSIGRYTHLTQSTGARGEITTTVDLAAIPQPAGAVAGMAGETWHFQLWHRDQNPTATSNLTESVTVTLR